MIANIPIPLPDQCLDSLVAAGWRDNGNRLSLHSWIMQVLGVRFNSALARGARQAFDALCGAGYRNPNELAEAHTHLPLFRPFARPWRIPTRARSGGCPTVSSLVIVLAASDTARIRQDRWYCAACARSDFACHGYGYARRVHQVIGVEYCPIHEVPLLRPRVTSRGAFPNFGLLQSPAELSEPSEWTARAGRPTRKYKFSSASESSSLPLSMDH
jgi:hypothetical protein